MAKYEQDVQALLRLIGGKENIRAVSHCMTRMRFVLADEKKADTDGIGKLPSVKGTFTQAGQYQVIIGNDVSTFYNEFTAYAGIEGVSKDAAKQAAKTNQNVVQRIMSSLGEIFAPLIPALICGGLILGFRNIIGEINFFNNGTQSLADISQFWAGTYSFLWLIGEAVFHLLPVGIVWSITKKMGTTQILGIVLGLTLVSSQLLNGFSVASTPADQIPVWDFGFAKVQMIGYQGQVIAAIMAGFVLVYLEKFFRKICPQVISMIVVPFCSLLPAVIIAHTIVGPIGWKIGNFIADVVYGGPLWFPRWPANNLVQPLDDYSDYIDLNDPMWNREIMDQLMVDVSQIPGAKAGDEAIVFGGPGADSLNDVAQKAGTIPYEIMCGLALRVPRVYLKDGRRTAISDFLKQNEGKAGILE